MKRALIIGINYQGRHQLEGCIKDALLLTRQIKTLKYKTLLLIDGKATYSNIIKSMKWLLEGDSLYFHFSGHGSSKGHILSYDLKPITKDLLRKKLIEKVATNSSKILRITLDCCFSSLLFDLIWETSVRSKIKKEGNDSSDIMVVLGFNNNGRNIDNKNGGVLTKVLLELLAKKEINSSDILAQTNKLKFYNQELKILSNKEIKSTTLFLPTP